MKKISKLFLVKTKLMTAIYAIASDQWELGEKLDQMVLMILDYGLNDNAGVNNEFNGEQFFLN